MFVPHPQVRMMAYASEGSRAVVYKVRKNSGSIHALKVFKKVYRTPALLDSAARLKVVESYSGFRAARRSVLPTSDPAVRAQPDLAYAILMPWLEGKTWFDILLEASTTGPPYNRGAAIRLCERFLQVMNQLESAGLAHTDIAPGNIVIGYKPLEIELIDLEDLYIPGTKPPEAMNYGSHGYRHPSADSGSSTWRAAGDRYATAVLSCEMLLLSDPDCARLATDAGFFVEDRRSQLGQQRLASATRCLRSFAPQFLNLFEAAWKSEKLESCPTVASFYQCVSELAKGAQPATFAARQPASPAATPAPAPAVVAAPATTQTPASSAAAKWVPNPRVQPASAPVKKPEKWGWLAPVAGVLTAIIASQIWEVSCYISARAFGVQNPWAGPHLAALSACNNSSAGPFAEGISAIAALVVTAFLGHRGKSPGKSFTLGLIVGIVLSIVIGATAPF